MNDRIYALFGVVGPLLAYALIGVSIALSPWFSFGTNALSDLGHAVNSGVASLYNFGLLLAGFLLTIYAFKALKKYARWTSYSLAFSAFALQLVAVFDEVYGVLHFVVSLLFFVSLGPTSILYAIERKSYLAATAFIIGLISWIFYWLGTYSSGVAVLENISSIAVASWIILSAIKICMSKQTHT